MPARRHPFTRLLQLLPAPIAALWVLGIARFRKWELDPLQAMGIVALAFALHMIVRRARPERPPVPLPPQANPRIVATLAAGFVGIVGLIVGGLVEYVVEQAYALQDVPWWLRTLWHGACAFAASWCRLLARYSPP